NKGFAIISGTNQGIYAEVKPHPSRLIVTSRLPDGEVVGPQSVEMDKNVLLEEAEKGGFFSYMAGVAYRVLTHYHVKGLEIDCHKMDLPLKKGLSSSAAVCVLAARAFKAFDVVVGEMECAYQGEVITPSRCGRLDQGCAYGRRPLKLTFDGELVHVDELTVKRPLYFFIVDLCAKKDTKEILIKLNQCYPFPQNDIEKDVHRLLGEINEDIIQRAGVAIDEGDAQAIGELMTEAQAQFDKCAAPACPSELEAPVLHKALGYGPIRDLVWGGKGVGSQGDGCAQFIAKDEESRDKAIEIFEMDLGMPCLKLDMAPPHRVRKAVIPVAGFGTRLFPASKAAKKELFPVVDRDGMAKPVILIIIEEALSAGIEEICLIVQEEDQELFNQFFNEHISAQNLHKLPTHFKEYVNYLHDIGRRIHFAVQDKQDGFGHAVYCAHEWVGDEPFLLMLGDHLYRSGSDTSCAGQLIESYEKHQTSVVGLAETPEDLIATFGTVAGEFLEDDENVLAIGEFAEKPNVDYARTNLQVEGVEEGTYLTVFGQYVLKPEIFHILRDHIENDIRERGEIQLTLALDTLRKREGFLGALIDGQRYDIGTPEAFAQTVVEFARSV
ncbi:sugar phosphate nucleotidyltransferase, partial [Candidatus Hydrogenedentota bacterium]